jgi:hypothetical protein
MNGDYIVKGQYSWAIVESKIDASAVYMLDGSQAIIAPFAGGGQQVKNIADGSDASDAVTKGQLDTHINADNPHNLDKSDVGLGFITTTGSGANYLADDGTYKPVESGGGGCETFTCLSDTPSSLGNDGDVFGMNGSSTDWIDLSDIYYTKSSFVDNSSGTGTAGRPVKLNSNGHIDSTMMEFDTLEYVGNTDPSNAGCDYPNSPEVGQYWSVNIIQAGTECYTFSCGDLGGEEICNGDFMLYGRDGWAKVKGKVEPSIVYLLDGTQAITADFAGGGYRLTNIAEPTADNDGATKQYVDDAIEAIPDPGSGSRQWVDVTSSRDFGTTYTNNTNSEMIVQVTAQAQSGSRGMIDMWYTINGSMTLCTGSFEIEPDNTPLYAGLSVTLAPGDTIRVDPDVHGGASGLDLTKWVEFTEI